MNEVLARESIRKFHFSLLSNYNISLSFFIVSGSGVQQPSSTGEARVVIGSKFDTGLKSRCSCEMLITLTENLCRSVTKVRAI